MPLFEWTPGFSVNIRELDEQHRKLVETINRLYDAMKEERGNDVLPHIFEDLKHYVSDHFASEERLMTRYKYPECAEHKQEHDRFAAKIAEFEKQFEQQEPALSGDLSIFLSNWLHDHMLTFDKKYSVFLNEKGVV